MLGELGFRVHMLCHWVGNSKLEVRDWEERTKVVRTLGLWGPRLFVGSVAMVVTDVF